MSTRPIKNILLLSILLVRCDTNVTLLLFASAARFFRCFRSPVKENKLQLQKCSVSIYINIGAAKWETKNIISIKLPKEFAKKRMVT